MLKKTHVFSAVALSFLMATSAMAGPGVGDPAVEFTLSDVYGVEHSLSDFQGKVLLLNFWASW